MKKLSQFFLQGLLVFVPLVVTVFVVYTVFMKIDRLFAFKLPGLGVAATILIVVAIGATTSTLLMRKLVLLVERLFEQLPLVKMLYGALKDLIRAFVGEKRNFNRPVLVSFGAEGDMQAIGFVTRTSLEHLGLKDRVAVFFPQSFNFAGNLMIFPKERVLPLEARPSDVMAMLVSGGISAGRNAEG